MKCFRKLSILLLVVAVGLICVGCGKIYFTTGVGKDNLFKIESISVPVQEAYILLGEEKYAYEASGYVGNWEEEFGDVTLEMYVKDQIKDQLVKITTINLLAQDKGITLTKEEKKSTTDAAETYYNQLTEEEKKSMDLSKDFVFEFYEKYALAEKTFSELTKDLVSQVSDVDAKVIKVQSIYVSKDEEKAKEAVKKIKEGQSFLQIASEYSEENEVEYTIKKGTTYPEFEEAAYQLKSGETSDVISTENGFYIIKCISDYLMFESEKNKTELLKREKATYFQNIYNPFADRLKFNLNKSLFKNLSLDQAQVPKQARFFEIYREFVKQ